MKQFITHGGQKIPIPVLHGPVGPDSADLRKKFPIYNSQPDVEIVQYYISQMQEIGFLPAVGPIKRACTAVNPGLDPSDVAALRELQKKLQVTDQAELASTIVRPGGETLKKLVDYGDYAGALDSLAHSKNPADFVFDRQYLPRSLSTPSQTEPKSGIFKLSDLLTPSSIQTFVGFLN